MSRILKDHHKLVFPKVKKAVSLCKSCVDSCCIPRVITNCPDYWERKNDKAKGR